MDQTLSYKKRDKAAIIKAANDPGADFADIARQYRVTPECVRYLATGELPPGYEAQKSEDIFE